MYREMRKFYQDLVKMGKEKTWVGVLLDHAINEYNHGVDPEAEMIVDGFALVQLLPEEVVNETLPNTKKYIQRLTAFESGRNDAEESLESESEAVGGVSSEGKTGRSEKWRTNDKRTARNDGRGNRVLTDNGIPGVPTNKKHDPRNRVNDGGKPPISIARDTLQRVVDEFKAKYPGLNINIVETQAELTDDPRVVSAQVEGNTVTIVRENIAIIREAEQALRHEVVGHLGMQKVRTTFC